MALAVLAAGAPARAALMLASPPNRPKDFCIVKKDGQFHIFYIRHDMTLGHDDTEKDFGHAVSYDLYTWTQLPTVLSVRTDNWDNQHVWAPTIVELDGVYYMLYAGVTKRDGDPAQEQRIGVATSTDLMNWNRLDQPVYSCRDVPWSWCDSTAVNDGFRDPFVMPDPAQPGHWLMYYSTFPATDTLGMIVGVAQSKGDLTQWTDLEPLWVTNRAYSYNPIVESPHVFQHGNLWFLFMTAGGAGQPISFFETHDPRAADPSAWVYRGRLATMLGIDTQSWYASEHFADGTNDLFAFVNYNRVEIYRMFWTAPDAFQLYEPGNFHIVSLNWGANAVQVGRPATFGVVATGWAGQEVDLEAVEELPGGGEVPLTIDDLGIPSSIPLTADTTWISWSPAIHHANGDTSTPETIVIRPIDHTAASPPLTIVPPLALNGLSWSADSVECGLPATLSIAASNWSGDSVALAAVERQPPAPDVPLDLPSLGLPASLALTGATTPLQWTARIRRPDGDTTSALNLVLQAPQFGLEAPPLRVTPPPPARVRSLRWSSASVPVGAGVTLCMQSTRMSGQTVSLEAVDHSAGDSLLTIGDLGLPSSVTIASDTTLIPWIGRVRRASGDTTVTQVLIVRTADHSVATLPLYVTPPDSAGETVSDDSDVRLPRFRRLPRSILGSAPAFLVDLPVAARVQLDIFDLQGRRVRRLVDDQLPKGATVLAWDGRNASGAPVGRGLYFARMTSGRVARTVKLVVTRPSGF
jgi:beta-fructofuranosidase